ncbi:MAG: glutathione synthase [Hydrococcus sp. SU_1_0]|nr:glutathione synthase [Hydrococcus sp. SU_1_0]NJO98511.1 glutathione synthase [Pleurocapsa sp. CRU_1_2]
MILLCGIPSETPLAMVREQLNKLNADYVWFNQRHFAEMAIEFKISASHLTGQLQIENQSYRLEDFAGVYTRLMDDSYLPELKDEPENSPKRNYCRTLHDTLNRWSEITPARVVNRIVPMGSNFSKPYQLQLIREYGFSIPETLITNDPELVCEFRERHLKIIYKSISGIRSIVQTLEEPDLAQLERIRWCPTQFQAFVEGTNVRVHVVNTEIFATAIYTDATDYRYAQRQGSDADLQAFKLSDDLANQCLNLVQGLKLAFAGIDLKIAPDGQVYCFEVNPSPAFSYYETNTRQPIARAVARYLATGV